MENDNKNLEVENNENGEKKVKYNLRRRVWVIASLSFFIVLITLSLYLYDKLNFKNIVFVPKYAQAYELISDSVSKSAPIKINLPKGAIKSEVINTVVFVPEIKGEWASTTEENSLLFMPANDLEVGKYYNVSISALQGKIGKDFKIEENPEVISVFPKNDSEVHEKSNITILFNRPMVPLTTLDKLEEFDIPVEISPKTEGKFKWIGTHSLQFIPKDTLVPSSNYLVKVKSDFVSIDGLNIKEYESKFITRPLRLENITNGKNIYNSPVKILFNQDIDLEKTKAEIWVKNVSEDKRVDFAAEYGSKEVYNEKKSEYETVIDKSAIFIYLKEDKHGRKNLWDFKTNYFIKIEKAFVSNGDIEWTGGKDGESYIQVPDIIDSITAESERSEFVNQSFFDPQGKLWINFFEEIDLEKSQIEGDYLIKKGYGEKCIDNGSEYVNFSTCEKTEDKSKVFLEFDAGKINKSYVIKLNFIKIKNLDGFQINSEQIFREATVIPNLLIHRTIPSDNGNNASLEEFYLCSNSPITSVGKDFIDEYLEFDNDYEFKFWDASVLVPEQPRNNYKCISGEFQTRIRYGLIPESDYEMKLKTVDHFGGESNFNISFRTQKIDSKSLNFFHFQKSYNVTTPDKTVLTYAAWNMDYVNLNICRLSGENMLRILEDKPEFWQSSSPGLGCLEAVEKKIDLDDKYWVKNYFKVNLADYVKNTKGHFVLTFSHPDYKTSRWINGQAETVSVYERTYLTSTNLSIVEKEVNLEGDDYFYSIPENKINSLQNLYWVSDLKTLNPINNASVAIFSFDGKTLKKDKTVYTDGQGVAKTAPINKTRGVVVASEDDSAIISDDTSKFEWGASAYGQSKIYIYSDRPIYKPGDEVNIKGLYRVGYDGDYEIFRDKKLQVLITDSSQKEIFNQGVEVNEYGTFNFKLILDKSVPLGQYNINVSDGFGYASFDVEEYVAAPFKLDVKTDKDEYVSGDTVKLELDANYYFGAPVEGGEVEYSVGSQDYYFDKYSNEYFNFGNDWYYCWQDCGFGDKFVYRGKTELDQNGKALITKEMNIDKLFIVDNERRSKIITVYMTVKNINGQSVSTQKSFIVHRGDFYLGVRTDKSFLGTGESFRIEAKSVDTEGKELKVEKIKLTVSKIEWIRNKRKEVDGGYYYKWEEKLDKKIEETFDTDKQGNWNGNFKLEENGSYEIKLEASDIKGNLISGKTNIYVWGEGQASIQPKNDSSLDIVAENTSLNVGGEASIIIKSPYEHAKALIGIERGQIFSYEILDINQSLYNYKFKIKEEYIPNVYISVVLLSPNPETKYGKVNFNINSKEKELDINVVPDKNYYLPGEQVNLDFEVKNSEGNPVEAELSTAVVDLSVLALKGNPKKNPVAFFYDGFPLAVSTVTNVNNILFEVDVPTGTKGGGGAEPDDLARKKRGEFKDTAFWRGVITADNEGNAHVSFVLPDNLTTWQVESVGITKDTKLGASYQEFIARKDVMITPLKPRFIVPGDKFYIGAKVFNQTDETQKLDVSFYSGSLILNDDIEKKLDLKAKESDTVYFSVEASSNTTEEFHSFILSAKNEKYEDTVENTISLTKNNTYETIATANYSKDNIINEYVFLPDNIIKEKGDLTVNHSATMAVFLSDALDYLFLYPYGCTEQVASKLMSIAIIKKGLALENIGDKYKEKLIEFDGNKYTADEAVELGLARLRVNQNNDGGFSYYPGHGSDYHLTLYVMTVLSDLKNAGYDVKDGEIQNSIKFITAQERQRFVNYGIRDLILSAYAISKTGNSISKFTVEKILAKENDEKFLNEELNNFYLPYLAIILAKNDGLFSEKYKDKVYDILENRISIDARGAFLPSDENSVWQYYETPIKNTGMLLETLVSDRRDDDILDKIIRWLLRSKSKDGSWGSTNNTLTVVEAMTNYLIWQQENKSNFTLSFDLNGVEQSKFTYGAETILEQNTFITQIKDLSFGEMNKIELKKENLNNVANNVYYDMSLKYYLPIDNIPPRDEGFTISRGLYALNDKAFENEVSKAKVGDVLKGHIEIIVPKQRNFVAIEDFIPAGVELVNLNLSTEDQSLAMEIKNDGNLGRPNSERDYWYYRNQYDDKLYPDVQEMRDDRMFLFKENLPPGTYTFDYFVRVSVPGKFNYLPIVVSEMYFPENFGRGRGRYFEIVR